MDWEIITRNWENEDFIKIALSLLAGLLLGIEREVKDKAAGFKTITIICLGSTLFTILSYKMGVGESEDATRIASYVVSGIGFLGAGVIFKDGITVNGLTTAGIIWIASAIGMSFGFGEYLIGLAFLFCSYLVILFGGKISRLFINKTSYKKFKITYLRSDYKFKSIIIKELHALCLSISSISSDVEEEKITTTFEITFRTKEWNEIEQMLIENPSIIRLEF